MTMSDGTVGIFYWEKGWWKAFNVETNHWGWAQCFDWDEQPSPPNCWIREFPFVEHDIF